MTFSFMRVSRPAVRFQESYGMAVLYSLQEKGPTAPVRGRQIWILDFRTGRISAFTGHRRETAVVGVHKELSDSFPIFTNVNIL